MSKYTEKLFLKMGMKYNNKKNDKKDDENKHIDNEHTKVKIVNPLFEDDEEEEDKQEEEIKME